MPNRLTLLVALFPLAALAQAFSLDGGSSFTLDLHSPYEAEPFRAGEKPSWSMPSHPSAELGLASRNERGRLHVIDVEAWKKHFAAGPKELQACVTAPLAALQRSLAAPRGALSANALLGCEDGTPAFLLWAKKVNFSGGAGWLYVTQWMFEAVLPSNRRLAIEFQGVTTDGEQFVVLTLPAHADGFTEDEGQLEFDRRAYERRSKERTQQLQQLGARSLSPSLDEVERVLRTLQISSRKP